MLGSNWCAWEEPSFCISCNAQILLLRYCSSVAMGAEIQRWSSIGFLYKPINKRKKKEECVKKYMDTTNETHWTFLYQNYIWITKVTILWPQNYSYCPDCGVQIRIIKVLRKWWHKQHEPRRLTIWAEFRIVLESKIIIQVFFRFFKNDQSSM